MDETFNQSPSDQAVFGKAGWLFFNNHGSLVDAEGRLAYDKNRLERGVAALDRNRRMLAAQGINYLFIVVPDKSSVYPEFLPDFIKPAGPTRLDQFIRELDRRFPDFPVIDLRQPLVVAKEHGQVYYKTDTHWNQIGAFAGYVAIMRQANRLFPELQPRSLAGFSLRAGKEKRGDIADIMNLPLTEPDIEMIPSPEFGYQKHEPTDQEKKRFNSLIFFEHANHRRPVLFAYRDSFMENLKGLLAAHEQRPHQPRSRRKTKNATLPHCGSTGFILPFRSIYIDSAFSKIRITCTR